jgi:lactate dehydrogenase-like 2-hydroxyacid dehydrogenase
MQNKSIDFLAAKKRKILLCGTESSSNSTAELT